MKKLLKYIIVISLLMVALWPNPNDRQTQYNINSISNKKLSTQIGYIREDFETTIGTIIDFKDKLNLSEIFPMK